MLPETAAVIKKSTVKRTVKRSRRAEKRKTPTGKPRKLEAVIHNQAGDEQDIKGIDRKEPQGKHINTYLSID
jgi:hypothetical protein